MAPVFLQHLSNQLVAALPLRYCIVPGKERLAMLLAAILSRVGKKLLGESGLFRSLQLFFELSLCIVLRYLERQIGCT